MFWADKVAQQLKERNLPLEWVDDMKTPSGRVHVGSLLGVVFHDLVFKALQDAKVNSKYTYVFENHDPMDDIPTYLPREQFEKYLGMPLFKIPSPVEGYENFAVYYATEFKEAFNAIGCHPEIIWTKDLYTSGKMNEAIKTVLDKALDIRQIYKEMYKKELPTDWYPFQVYCENCGKVSTTRVYAWDGEYVEYRCPIDATEWTKGCGHEGKTSPFSNEKEMKGKLPWKVEWPAKWMAIGVTVEGAGKDHMSKGGSHDMAKLFCERIFHYPVPYPVPYEFMLIGGKKMSSSKGRGFAASDMVTIIPPELVRFLIVKMDPSQQTNFDPDGDTIPRLFDEYQEYARHYIEKKNDEEARIFELSQIDGITIPPLDIRFATLAQWVQMPNMQEKIKKEGLEHWAKYARIWVERFAPEKDTFKVQQEIPDIARTLSSKQKSFLNDVVEMLSSSWEADELQKAIYEKAKERELPSKEAFSALYLPLLGKGHGPRAGWLILSLDKEFVKKRFSEVSMLLDSPSGQKEEKKISSTITSSISPATFTIDEAVKKAYPSISIGIAIIKGITIAKADEELLKKREELLASFSDLTTERLGQLPEILSYRRLYKEMGVDWHSRRPSPEALLRRVALKKNMPSINTCVDAYNMVVMKHRVSIGAFDLDAVSFPTALRYPKLGESILLLGDLGSTLYKEKEISYFDQNGGYNLDFNYRDAQRTAVTDTTKNILLNVDGVFDITPEKVDEALHEAIDMIITYCGGTAEVAGVVTAQ